MGQQDRATRSFPTIFLNLNITKSLFNSYELIEHESLTLRKGIGILTVLNMRFCSVQEYFDLTEFLLV